MVLLASAGIHRPIEAIKKAMEDFHWKDDHDFVYADFLSLCRTLDCVDESEHNDEQDGENTTIPDHMSEDIAALYDDLHQRMKSQEFPAVPVNECSNRCTLQEADSDME